MRTRKQNSGFTLIELMIALVVAAILATIAVPAFVEQARSSRRGDAHAAILALQLAQEQFRANCTQYATGLNTTPGNDVCDTGAGTYTLNRLGTSDQGYYTLSFSGVDATGFTVEADPAADGPQKSDTACDPITLTVSNATATTTKGPSDDCW